MPGNVDASMPASSIDINVAETSTSADLDAGLRGDADSDAGILHGRLCLVVNLKRKCTSIIFKRKARTDNARS